MQDILG